MTRCTRCPKLTLGPSHASVADGIAGMNGNMYTGGYSQGNFAYVGVKANGVDVNPEPCQTLWGTTHSSKQNFYIAGNRLPHTHLLHTRSTNRVDPLATFAPQRCLPRAR